MEEETLLKSSSTYLTVTLGTCTAFMVVQLIQRGERGGGWKSIVYLSGH